MECGKQHKTDRVWKPAPWNAWVNVKRLLLKDGYKEVCWPCPTILFMGQTRESPNLCSPAAVFHEVWLGLRPLAFSFARREPEGFLVIA